ncbi:crossover junction endodeoxyribonuclease RuvC [candidate division WOR-3 bacterium]|nr:crossover junction endodeoxyribonuclease RuvC [candidate division WOR-3 bacterium]
MKILGIDPGLSATGIAFLEVTDEVKVIHWDIIKYSQSKGAKRIHKYFKSLSKIIDRENPDLLVMEKVFRGPNAVTLIKLGELRGAYLLLAEIKGIPVVEFTPREIKQSVTGSGASSKTQVRYMVKSILNLNEEIPLDVSDAFGTIICYLNKRGEHAGIH